MVGDVSREKDIIFEEYFVTACRVIELTDREDTQVKVSRSLDAKLG